MVFYNFIKKAVNSILYSIYLETALYGTQNYTRTFHLALNKSLSYNKAIWSFMTKLVTICGAYKYIKYKS